METEIKETLFFSVDKKGFPCVKNSKGNIIATGSSDEMKELAFESRKKFPIKRKMSPELYKKVITVNGTKDYEASSITVGSNDGKFEG